MIQKIYAFLLGYVNTLFNGNKVIFFEEYNSISIDLKGFYKSIENKLFRISFSNS